MNILLLNDGYFLQSLRRLGHRVFFASIAPEADLRPNGAPVAVQDVLKACPFAPDFILCSDSINLRMAFAGLDGIEIPLVFFGVDAPMNVFWQSDFSLACDLAFLDQKQSVDALHAAHTQDKARIHWLPLGADQRLYRKLPVEKCYDVVFIGSLQPRLRPKRDWILEQIRKDFNLVVFDGQNRRSLTPAQVVKIYSQARIVVNENLFPGLNLRLFEVMSCGACLLTEEGDGSWQPFFQDGEHLVTFNSANLTERIAALLEQETRRERIAAQGMELVRREHTIDCRAQSLLSIVSDYLANGPGSKTGRKRSYHFGKAYLALAQRWPDQPVAALKLEALNLLLHEVASGGESADLHFELAAQALGEGRRLDALASLRRALRLNPSHLRSIWSSFWCLREIGEHYRAAQEIVRLRRCLKLPPPNRASYEALVGGRELSAQDYLDLGEILENAGWLFEAGTERSAGHPGRWNAFDAYQKAIALDPALSESYLKCADLLERGSCPEFALLLVEKAASIRAFDADLRLRYARLLLGLYRRPEGCEQVIQFLFLSSASDKWEKARALGLSEAEWNHLLSHVQDLSAKPVVRRLEKSLASAANAAGEATQARNAVDCSIP